MTVRVQMSCDARNAMLRLDAMNAALKAAGFQRTVALDRMPLSVRFAFPWCVVERAGVPWRT